MVNHNEPNVQDQFTSKGTNGDPLLKTTPTNFMPKWIAIYYFYS